MTADRFIVAQLSADATLAALGIYEDESVPADATYPNVQFRLVAPGSDRFAIGDIRIMSAPVYVVLVVERFTQLSPNYTSIESYADRIDAQLHQQSGVVTGSGQVFRSHRLEPWQRARMYQGIQYRELGGRYQVYVQDS